MDAAHKNPPLTEVEQSFLRRAEQYCSAEERCLTAVRGKLVGWGATEHSVNRICVSLLEQGFVDDQRYANMYCESKVRTQGWGRIKIAYQLRTKSLHSAVIDKALSNIDKELYTNNLRKAARDKWGELPHDDYARSRNKVIAHLSSRGYTLGEIMSEIDSIVEPSQESQQWLAEVDA
ncbi:MAG: RecX family transcriptional regulator [Bacteroidales bacterium]|nr:RecX family transcriptional regulator [Bacteroidales bacterium]